ncbi:hypothetical protein EN866_34420 [Mesorhizobium sp. M2D.F.Ca.ET.223.01.1.1]|uniref:hypothetical protein n=1 Tax=Mesorhizobium sp. M2D.F.Ca.ET.223.01.1.1 TaxID=2563940 RepID=UPI001092B043|nr:hypothetical protein [Mesorhizobium sp. M2D.F.Ca.ET.223.01.1.1]TGR83027.1 hypothetical protein EN866_34420 [Mesorhizobium sp. M2D.F.Ca.ET.223.01.1.1]TGT65295.1 hypothetical protein EN802_31945 [bacterium M00.F.Ca.ET.159.01.1.1]TGT79406.1 hypothetical protein EN800_31285 [bacterium M00.F.Ca.ET.157.01.1.1]
MTDFEQSSARAPFGEPKRFLLDVVLAYEGDECLLWPYARTGDGRGAIRLDGRLQVVSRRVCEITHGPPPTLEHEAAHSCGRGHEGCCTKRHLSWKTPAGNSADRVAHGTHARGQQNGRAKLSADRALEIYRMKGTATNRDLARIYGVSRQTVSLIHTGKHWACRA